MALLIKSDGSRPQEVSPKNKNRILIPIKDEDTHSKGFQKFIHIMEANPNYEIFKLLETYLIRMDKDLLWLMDETMDISRATYHSYLTGQQNLSMTSLDILCKTINKNGGKVISPKQFIPPDYLEKSVLLTPPLIFNNVKYLMTITNTSLKDIEIETGIDGSVLSRPVRNLSGISFKVYKLLFRYFTKIKGVNLIDPLELIYFPGWNEKEYTYIGLRKLISKKYKVNQNQSGISKRDKFKTTSKITHYKPVLG